MHPYPLLVPRLARLLAGLFLYGIAISLMVKAGVGLSPWDALAQGVSLRTGLPFGLVTNLIGCLVLLFWIPLRQRPGVGTVLNVVLVGPSAQLGLALIPAPSTLLFQISFFAAGLLLLAFATGLYIGPRLGPGPRDGLMTGIHRRTGWPIWVGRTSIELVVLSVGWLLGGTVGFGTIAFALLVGPLCGLALPRLAMRIPRPADPGAASATVAPVEPEAGGITTANPEPASITTANPEPASISTANPEPASISTPNPEPASISTPNPEPASISTANPEPASTSITDPRTLSHETDIHETRGAALTTQSARSA